MPIAIELLKPEKKPGSTELMTLPAVQTALPQWATRKMPPEPAVRKLMTVRESRHRTPLLLQGTMEKGHEQRHGLTAELSLLCSHCGFSS